MMIRDEASNERNVRDLQEVINEINHTLSSEANRLGVPVPELPDPNVTAEALSTMVANAADSAINPNSPYSDEIASVEEMSQEIPYEIAKEAYRFEEDIMREVRGLERDVSRLF